jgi:hypothetical protein
MNQLRAPLLVGFATVAFLVFRPTQSVPNAPVIGESPVGLSNAAAADGTKATAAEKPAGAAAAGKAVSRREYARLYRDLLGIESLKPTPPAKTAVRGSLAAQPLSLEISAKPAERSVDDDALCEIATRARRSGYHLNFMIVLVPDPIDSGLASDFDLTMSALQSGLAEAGYRLDRQWLPWVEPESSESRAYRETAGLMLFRRGPRSLVDEPEAGDQLLAVFLVGETLKLGIHKAAFQRSVDFILDLHAQDISIPLDAGPAWAAALPPYQPCPEIPVLGPSSSGSVESLRLALDRDGPCTCFRIVSGAASAPGVEARMEETLPGNAKVTVRFSRTVVPDDALAEKGLAFLQEELGWNLDRAALLVERDTAYGSYFSGVSLKEPQNPLLARITKLYFPSGLFALRNAWEASGAIPVQAAAGSPKAATPKTALEVSLADQRTPVDVVPELSPLTARIYDMALADLLRYIASEGFTYIGILATDVKDQLFLAEQIRRWAPGTVLFVVDDNLLYVHPQYNATTFGMLTISSFPLAVEGGQRLVSPALLEPRSRRQFASERQEGTFLAVRSLVSGLAPTNRLVWIAGVGNYSMWPLARRGFVTSEREAPAVEALGPSRGDTPPAWTKEPPDRMDLNLAFLAFLACVVSYLLRREALGWAQIQSRTRRLLSGAAAFLCLAGAFLVGLWVTSLCASFTARGDVASPARIIGYWPALPGSWPAWVLGSWRAWVLLGLLVLGYGYLAHSLVVTLGLRVRRRWALAAAIMLLLLAPPLVVFALWRVDDFELFFLRVRAFTGGLSPLVSLAWLAGACFLWLVVELKRQWVARRHQVPWPLEPFHDPALGGCKARADKIDKLLQAAIPPGRGYWIVTLALVAPPALFLWTRIQPIAESRCYGRVFLLLTAGLAILSTMALLRFLRAWWLISGVLRRIQQSELFPALKEVAPEMEWQPTHFSRYQPSFTAVKRSADRLQRLIDRRVVVEPPGLDDLSHLLESLITATGEGRISAELGCRDALALRCAWAVEFLAGRLAVQGVKPFYAVRLIAYLQHVFNQLRYSIMGAMACDLALIGGASTFAFQPKSFLTLALWSTLVAASAATLVIFVQMERDATLSVIGRTDIGKITYNWAFLSKLLVYTVLPVLGLIASQFPSMGRLFNSLFDPLARVLGTGG